MLKKVAEIKNYLLYIIQFLAKFGFMCTLGCFSALVVCYYCGPCLFQPSNRGDDRALCFTCNVCLVCWEPTDEPW